MTISFAIRVAGALCVGLLSSGSLFGAEWSIQEFNALKPRWPNIAALPQTIVLEGRLSSIAPHKFRMRNCDIPFEIVEGKPLPKLPKRTRTVTVTGRLIQKGKRFVFRVTSLKARPTDLEVFDKKRRTVPVGKSDGWYALGKWARERAAFYRDDELRKRAAEAYRIGVTREKELLARDDGEGLLKLAARVERLEIPGRLPQTWTHEAHRRRWSAYQKAGDPSFVELIKPFSVDLPGCFTAAKSFDEKLAAAYAKVPLTTYGDATAGERTQLHRLFYVEIQLYEIHKDAAVDGSNGLEIAKRIEKAVPERADLAKTYRDRGLDYRLKHADALERADALALAETFRRRKQPKLATDVLTRWLKSQTVKRANDGIVGLLTLADDYERLLGDKKTAYEYLMVAYRKNSRANGIAERMNRLGYVLKNGRWVAQGDEPAARPAEKRDKDSVAIDMTPQQVRGVMFGSPASVTRIATARGIHEVWVYGTPGKTTLAVHFYRLRSVARADAKVVNITDAGVRARR